MNTERSHVDDETAHTFGFVDLAGFTALTEVHGDADAVVLIQRFIELAEATLADDTGTLVKTIGDAVMLRFATPTEALAAMQQLFADVAAEPDFPALRAGLNHGPAIALGGDFFGSTVNLAARIAGEARGGQLLAALIVAEAAEDVGLEIIDLGDFHLRNLVEPVRLYEVVLGPPIAPTAIDPVCRMTVDPHQAIGRIHHAGVDYWLCSLKCAAAFTAAPEAYV